MDSGDLKAFAAFADTLNFTHAAQKVHLPQPALFPLVKRLATQVDAPLYDWEEKLWLSLETARQALARALARMVEEGMIDEVQALEMARRVLRDNARAVYALQP